LLSKRDFEFGHLVTDRRDPGKHVTGQEAQRELVRVLKDAYLADGQI
jgi:hypothetical protein